MILYEREADFVQHRNGEGYSVREKDSNAASGEV